MTDRVGKFTIMESHHLVLHAQSIMIHVLGMQIRMTENVFMFLVKKGVVLDATHNNLTYLLLIAVRFQSLRITNEIMLNYYDNLEHCYFMLNNCEYFKKFNREEGLRKKFANAIAPLVTKVKIKKRDLVVCEI